jgi:hypothetical protein
MRHPMLCGRQLLAIPAAVFLIAGVASAQDKLDQLGKANQNFGMDDITFRRLFGPAFTDRRAGIPTSFTVEGLADQVAEIRIFLTTTANTVVGEIAIAGKTRLSQITIPLDKGATRFLDSGQAPDKTKGDGVFTAQFPMETGALWQSLRAELAASAQALKTPDGRQFIRRGPRDIVPVKDALETLRTKAPGLLTAITSGAERLAQISRADDPLSAAKLAQVDIAKTPFLIFPGPEFDPKMPFDFRRAFGIPFFDFFPFPLPAPPVPIDHAKSLMVVDPGVVDNAPRTFDVCTGAGTPGGPWSFGHLMREMSSGTGMTPEDFTMLWLSTWMLPQEANAFIVNEPGRAAQLQSRIINGWQLASGATLNVDKFPARLLAIVNRPDLADKIGYGVAGSAGEGRFVFGLLEKTATSCNSLPFTVIFEYGIKGGSCSAVKAWHQRWKNLDANPVGSPAYNTALELITRDFTDHGSNPGQLPNQSALNQLRTNEIALSAPWQLREFRLQTTGAVAPGVLDLVTVKQTPDDGFRNGTVGTPAVAAYIISREADILGNRHVVPERFPGLFNPFMGAKSNVDFPPNDVFWNAPGLTTPPMTDAAEARRKFSLSTCNACHGGETNTFFTHIGNIGERNPGSPADLSGFLKGINVTVPVTGGIHHYEDLAEREIAMSNILTNSCFGLLGLRRIPFVH